MHQTSYSVHDEALLVCCQTFVCMYVCMYICTYIPPYVRVRVLKLRNILYFPTVLKSRLGPSRLGKQGTHAHDSASIDSIVPS